MEKSHRVEPGVLLNFKSEYTLKLTKNQDLLWANNSVLSLTKISSKEITRKKCRDLLRSADCWCSECPLDEVLASGEPLYKLIGSESNKLWFVTIKPVLDKEGCIRNIWEYTLDVSPLLSRVRMEDKSQFMVIHDTGLFICKFNSNSDIELSDSNKSWFRLVREEDIAYIVEKLKTGINIKFSECIKLTSGEWKTIIIIPTILKKKDNGEPELVGGTIRFEENAKEFMELKLNDNRQVMFYRNKINSLKMEHVSKSCFELTGLSSEELEKKGKDRYRDLIIHEDKQKVMETLRNHGKSFELSYRICTVNKKIKWVLEKGEVVDKGIVEGFITDITSLKQEEDALKNAEKKYRLLFQNATDAILLHEVNSSYEFGKIIEANKAACELLGYTRQELLELTPYDLKKTSFTNNETLAKRLIKEKNIILRDAIFAKSGKKILVEMNSHCFPMDGNLVVLSIIRDITLREKWEKRIEYLSFHDYLTGLYNRAFLDEELKRLNVQRQLPLSIIMGDLNGLKLVNDIFGHKEGDNLIIKTARVIQRQCREEDIVSRWGGDEFIVLLPRTTEKEAKVICERIRSTEMGDSEEIENFLPVNIALGWATKTTKIQLIGDIIKKAEEMMYNSKMQESRNLKFSVIESIRNKFHELEYESKEHTERVQKICKEFGAYLGLGKIESEDLRLLARFHDIGKIVIPPKILFKKTELTSGEKEMIKKHVEISWRIAKTSIDLSRIAEGMLSHHEWWNGDGYPRGIAGEKIPFITRVFAIVEAYDRMVYGASYKEAVTKEICLEELIRNAGSQFDPKLVTRFIGFINGRKDE